MPEEFQPRIVTQFHDEMTGIAGFIEHHPSEPEPYDAHISQHVQRFQVRTNHTFASLPEAEAWLEEVRVQWTRPAKRY